VSDDVSRETPRADVPLTEPLAPLPEGAPDATPVSPPPSPPAAASVFGDRLALAERYVAHLADTGVTHGLVGPREVSRLWERHVLNCAVVQDAFPEGAVVIDVGSGAGLPGIALVLARPDLEVHLVEPMLRRTTWLESVLGDLGLSGVRVHRGRAEELAGVVTAPWATARAVARLATLATWSVPLLEDGGTLVAIKGRSAEAELADDVRTLRRLGMTASVVTQHGGHLLEEPTTTVDLTFAVDAVRWAERGSRRMPPRASRPRRRR
jgi:16S rRNA (guanine527-N7)-methyltransferase